MADELFAAQTYRTRDQSTDTLAVTAAFVMTIHDRIVRATTSGAGAYSITLPPVAECQGLLFSICLVSKTTDNVTVADNNDSENWAGTGSGADPVLDTTGDSILLYSDGRKWWAIGGTFT